MGFSVDELTKAISQLPHGVLETVLAQRKGQQVAKTPKLSVAIFAVAVSAVTGVVRACREGIKASRDGELAPLMDVAPALASAALANSGYRGKPIAHSLQAIATRLQEIHGPVPETTDEEEE